MTSARTMKTSLIQTVFITLLVILSIILGVYILNDISKQNAMLNEYEYVLADVWAEKEKIWAEKEKCKEQLGVFYKK